MYVVVVVEGVRVVVLAGVSVVVVSKIMGSVPVMSLASMMISDVEGLVVGTGVVDVDVGIRVVVVESGGGVELETSVLLEDARKGLIFDMYA